MATVVVVTSIATPYTKRSHSSCRVLHLKGVPKTYPLPESDFIFLFVLEHRFQEKKSQSQNSIQHFEFFRAFFSKSKPAILPAGPLLLDCQC